MTRIIEIQKAVNALQSVHFVAAGQLKAATVQALRECLSDDDAAHPLMDDVQEIMRQYYRDSTKISNAANILMRAITQE